MCISPAARVEVAGASLLGGGACLLRLMLDSGGQLISQLRGDCGRRRGSWVGLYALNVEYHLLKPDVFGAVRLVLLQVSRGVCCVYSHR